MMMPTAAPMMAPTNSIPLPAVSASVPLPRPAPRERVKVLVMLRADGWVEVYGEKNLDVHIVQRLNAGAEDAALANNIDRFHERTMPRAYRALHWPGKLRAFDQCRTVTPETMLNSIHLLTILQGFRELRREVGR
jgi:hypothetical protein